MLDVLPSALVVTAAVTRAFGRELAAPLPLPVLEPAGLSAAVTEFLTRWSAALDDLAQAAEDRAAALQQSATEYAAVDAALVPRALR